MISTLDVIVWIAASIERFAMILRDRPSKDPWVRRLALECRNGELGTVIHSMGINNNFSSCMTNRHIRQTHE